MEAASAKERARAKALEKDEIGLNADELRLALRRERQRSSKMAADLAALRALAVQSQFEAEVLEEGRINGLMRRLDILQQEKGRIIVELEREEEMVRNIAWEFLTRAVGESTNGFSHKFIMFRTRLEFVVHTAYKHATAQACRSSRGESCARASNRQRKKGSRDSSVAAERFAEHTPICCRSTGRAR